MNRKLFLLGFWGIILVSFLIRLIPNWGNNFYFTMDQGNDAVWVREILERHQLVLKGPETGIAGLFAGPLWFYFIGLGFALFGGHPFGSVFSLIVLNTALIGILMWRVVKINQLTALILGASLQIFWPFFDASRYGFNPFPLVALSLLMIILLADTNQKNPCRLALAAIPVGLAFHAEVAGAMALLLFYLIASSWLVIRRVVSAKTLVIGITIVALFFLPHFFSDLTSEFSQFQTLRNEFSQPTGTFSGTNFTFTTPQFLGLATNSLLPQSIKASLLFLAAVIFLAFLNRKTNGFTIRFVLLSAGLWLISWLFLGANKGWRPWQTAYLPPLLFTSVLLLILGLPGKTKIALLAIIIFSQFYYFQGRYQDLFQPTADPSILANEMKAIDWIYQKSQFTSFYVYSYLPSVLDYPYQYLFGWYGRKKYGYLPCEYSSFPGTPDLFVPGLKYYQKPKKECAKLRFLIIEPDKNTVVQDQWLEETRQNTTLLEQTKIGEITVESRSMPAE